MRRAKFQLTAATAISVATLVAGCGGSHTSVTSTQASSAPGATTNPARGRDYPAKFEDGFLASCEEGASKRACVCELAYVEEHVPHKTAVQEMQDSSFVSSESYQRATVTCKHA